MPPSVPRTKPNPAPTAAGPKPGRLPRRAWRLVLASLALALFCAAGPAAAGQVVRVMTYNIDAGLNCFTRQNEINTALKVMAAQKPDILVVQELHSYALDVSLATGLKHRHAIKSYGKEKWRRQGLGIFSRWPMKVQEFPLGDPSNKRSFIRARIQVGKRWISFYAVHMSRAGLLNQGAKGLLNEVLGRGPRMLQMENLAEMIKLDAYPLKIAAGDMNTFPYSGPYRVLNGVLNDAFGLTEMTGSFRLDTTKSSWMKKMPNPKIDHIFHSERLKVVRAFVVRQGVSDHFPVLAEFELK